MYVRVNASTDLYAYEHPLETGIWTATGHHSVHYFEWWDYCLPPMYANPPCNSGAAGSVIALAQTGAQAAVSAPPCPRTTYEDQLASNFQVRPSNVRAEYNFAIQNDAFSYYIVGYSISSERGALADHMNAWNNTVHNECGSPLRVTGSVSLTNNPFTRLEVRTADEMAGGRCGPFQASAGGDVITTRADSLRGVLQGLTVGVTRWCMKLDPAFLRPWLGWRR